MRRSLMKEVRMLKRALDAVLDLDATGQEYVAAWLLNTTQRQLVDAGFRVKARSVPSR